MSPRMASAVVVGRAHRPVRVADAPIGRMIVPMGVNVMDRASERTAGIIGLVGVIIALAGLPLAPKWPEADAPLEVVRTYFSENGRAFLTQNCVVWFGFVLFGAFFVGASLRLVRAGLHGLGA